MGTISEYKRPTLLDEKPITSLEDLAAAVVRAQSALNTKALWFRGHADLHWQLQPWVFRTPQMATAEPNYAQRFRAAAVSRDSGCPSEDNHFGWLSFMRHHRVPNRLLDWTGSILIATFFATDDDSEAGSQDSAVWAFSPYGLHASYGMGPTLLSPDTVPIQESASVPFLAQRIQLYPSRVYAVVSAETSLRMLAQRATFTIHAGKEYAIEDRPHSESFLRGFVIENGYRQKLRADLEALGITRSMLFPDLDTLADSIRESEEPLTSTFAIFPHHAARLRCSSSVRRRSLGSFVTHA